MVQVIWQQEEMHEGEFHYDDEHDEVHVASSDLPHVHDGNVVVMIPTGLDSAYPQAGGYLSLNVDFYHYLLTIASFTNLSLSTSSQNPQHPSSRKYPIASSSSYVSTF